jgi:hypothetical protein
LHDLGVVALPLEHLRVDSLRSSWGGATTPQWILGWPRLPQRSLGVAWPPPIDIRGGRKTLLGMAVLSVGGGAGHPNEHWYPLGGDRITLGAPWGHLKVLCGWCDHPRSCGGWLEQFSFLK